MALLPFAIGLPSRNHQRVVARKEGAALIATLRPGELLGATPDAFADTHPGVRVSRGPQPDYVVLRVDMGGYPGNNLDKDGDVAMVGVRAGRIEWVAPSTHSFSGATALGLKSSLLCLNSKGIPTHSRPGC